MTRRPRTAPGMESLDGLAEKVKVLEREMALQRTALERLKEMGADHRLSEQREIPPARKTA
jgi:hypothetical protein